MPLSRSAILAPRFLHDALGLVEPPHWSPVAHALTVTLWTRERPHAMRPFTGPRRIAEFHSNHEAVQTA